MPYKKLPPGIKKLIIVADRRPADGELGADGKPLREGHDRGLPRAADHWLLELGDGNVLVTPDPSAAAVQGQRPDPADARCRGAARLGPAGDASAALPDGWISKLGRMADLDYEKQRKELAEELGDYPAVRPGRHAQAGPGRGRNR